MSDTTARPPSRSGLQLMTNVCEKFACLHQLKFSTNVDVDQEWKLPILHELLKVKDYYFVLKNFVDIEISPMVNLSYTD